MLYWHITPHTRTPKILKDGIQPGKRPQWKNVFGGRQGHRGFIYIFSSFDMAIQFASRLEWEIRDAKNNAVDIIEVDVEFDVEEDPHSENHMNGKTWWRTPHAIQPDSIRKVIPLTLKMRQDFIARRNSTSL